MSATPRKMTRKTRMLRLLALGVFSVIVWLLCSYYAVYRLTRRVEPIRPESAPAIAWGKVTPLRLATSDGHDLGAWFIEGRADRPLVLILHGHGGSRSLCLGEAEFIARTGSPVLMVSFRAHGDSTGEVNDFGYGGRHDVLAAVAWVRERHPGRPVVIWGRSMGAAAALFAAEELGDKVTGYILECPYQDLRTATRNRTRLVLPRGLEYVVYSGMSVMASTVLPHVDEISPLNAAAKFPPSASALVLAGGADTRALPAEAAAITQAIGDRAELVVIDGADHSQLEVTDPKTIRRVITGYLDKCRAGGK